MSSLRADEKHIQQTSLSTFHMISDVCGRPELIPAMISALGQNKAKKMPPASSGVQDPPLSRGLVRNGILL